MEFSQTERRSSDPSFTALELNQLSELNGSYWAMWWLLLVANLLGLPALLVPSPQVLDNPNDLGPVVSVEAMRLAALIMLRLGTVYLLNAFFRQAKPWIRLERFFIVCYYVVGFAMPIVAVVATGLHVRALARRLGLPGGFFGFKGSYLQKLIESREIAEQGGGLS